MRTPGKAALSLLVPLLLATTALAGVTVEQHSRAQPVGTDDVIPLQVDVSGASGPVQVSLPPGDFQVLGRSRSSSVSMVDTGQGMQVQRSERFLFQLRARHPGAVTIPGAHVLADGQELTAAPTTLSVQSGHVATAQADAAGDDDSDPLSGTDPMAAALARMHRMMGGADPFARGLLDEDERSLPGGMAAADRPVRPGEVKLEAVVEPRSAVPGQQVTVSYYLHTQVPLARIEGLQLPDFQGASTHDLAVSGHPALEPSGDGFRVLIAKKALFPLTAGALQLKAATATVAPAEGFDPRPIRVASSAVSIEVRPLPDSSAEAAVGRWDLTLSAPSRLRAHEAATFRATVSGTGDLASLPTPALQLPPDWRRFAPTSTQQESLSNGKVGGTRTWEWTAIPAHDGPITISAMTMAAFDPLARKSYVARSQALELKVEPGVPVATTAAPAPVQAAAALAPRSFGPVALAVGLAGGLGAGMLLMFMLGRRPASSAQCTAANLGAARQELRAARRLGQPATAAACLKRATHALSLTVWSVDATVCLSEDPGEVRRKMMQAGLPAATAEVIARAMEGHGRAAFLGNADADVLQRVLDQIEEALGAVENTATGGAPTSTPHFA